MGKRRCCYAAGEQQAMPIFKEGMGMLRQSNVGNYVSVTCVVT